MKKSDYNFWLAITYEIVLDLKANCNSFFYFLVLGAVIFPDNNIGLVLIIWSFTGATRKSDGRLQSLR